MYEEEVGGQEQKEKEEERERWQVGGSSVTPALGCSAEYNSTAVQP